MTCGPRGRYGRRRMTPEISEVLGHTVTQWHPVAPKVLQRDFQALAPNASGKFPVPVRCALGPWPFSRSSRARGAPLIGRGGARPDQLIFMRR